MKTWRLDRKGMISRERLFELSRLSTARVIRTVVLDYAVIVAAVIVSELYWSPPVYLLAVMTIGARQVGTFSIGLHDGAHRLISRNRARNDRLAQLLLLPSVMTLRLRTYRDDHSAHHRHVNGPRDPDLEVFQRWYAAPPWRRVLWLLEALAGMRVLVPWCRLLRSGKWRHRALAAATPAALVAGMVVAMTPVRLFVLYWVVPFATWVMFINLVRSVAEHYPAGTGARAVDTPPVFLTRDVVPSLFDSHFVVTRGVNYHLTHHLFPSVPFFRLAALQREIARTEPYRRWAHVTRGYHRLLWEILFDRAAGKTARTV